MTSKYVHFDALSFQQAGLCSDGADLPSRPHAFHDIHAHEEMLDTTCVQL